MVVKVADTHEYVWRLVLVVKMVTLLEEYTSEEQRLVFLSLFFVCACVCARTGKNIQFRGYSKRNVFCLWWKVFVAYSGSQLGREIDTLVVKVPLMVKKLKCRCGSS
jgi:hypothetical protein